MRRSALASIEIRDPPPATKESKPISERVRRNLSAYTAAENRVAQALLEDYPVAGLETVARFAKRAGTSGPTILRFVNHRHTLPFALQQSADYGGPAEMYNVGEVEDVVITIVVRLFDVVSESVTEVDPVTPQGDGSLRAAQAFPKIDN